jgi:hypothetical protein
VLDRAAEYLVVIEIEINHFTKSIHTDTCDVMSQVLAAAVYPIREPFFLTPWVCSVLTALISIPIIGDKAPHKQ